MRGLGVCSMVELWYVCCGLLVHCFKVNQSKFKAVHADSFHTGPRIPVDTILDVNALMHSFNFLVSRDFLPNLFNCQVYCQEGISSSPCLTSHDF